MSDARDMIHPLRGAYDHLLNELKKALQESTELAPSGDLNAIGVALAKAQQLHTTLQHLSVASELLESDSEPEPGPEPDPVVPSAAVFEPPAAPPEPLPEPEIPSIPVPVSAEAPLPPAPPAPAKVKPTARQKDILAFCASSREIESPKYDLCAKQASVKALVCRGQALIADSKGSHDQTSMLEDEIQHIQADWNHRGPGEEFFGFGLQRSHSAKVWLSIAEAYDLLQSADECVQWLGSLDEDTRAECTELISQAAAAETLLMRRLANSPAGVVDVQQVQIHHQLHDLKVDFFVPWWSSELTGPKPDADLLQVAKRLPVNFASTKTQTERGAVRRRASQALESALSARFSDEYYEKLADATEECIAAGMKHSDKGLRSLLRPYRHMLAELNRPTLKRLIEQLGTDATLNQRKGIVPPDEDVEPDLDFEQRLEELKAVTKGQRILFVGGNKGQVERQVKIRELLELSEFLWPDAEDHTNVKVFDPMITRSDIVCRLIRWSRHSYKLVLDDAKAQGKLTATLARGIGLNTIVFDLHEQLCRNSSLFRKLEPTSESNTMKS